MPRRTIKPVGVKPFIWMIRNPETGMYLRVPRTGGYPRWIRNPFAFLSENHLLAGCRIAVIQCPNAQVVPYALDTSLQTNAEDYGK